MEDRAYVKHVSWPAAAAALVLLSVTGGTAQQPPLFRSGSELVVLHVLVTDRHGAYVGGLPADAFRVYDGPDAQQVRFFAAEDAPVTIGLLIDSSGSMATVRDRVIEASTAFVASSNPRDEVFAIVFDDSVRDVLEPSAPFTNDPGVLEHALADAFRPAGRTALYDAVDRGLRYVRRGSRERQVLVVVSDGGDNASRTGFTGAMTSTAASNTAVYTVALVDPVDTDADPGRLARFAAVSGGASFAPHDVAGVDRALQQIARAIRHSYTLGYEPADGRRARGFRRLRVEVRSPDGRRLVTRTREGYHVP
jgi:Ca-activated chloride channel family protein